MWLNVIQARLNTRQCWPAVFTTNRMWGGLGVQQGLSDLQHFRRSQSFCSCCFCVQQLQLFFAPNPPSSLDAVLVSICSSFPSDSQCDGAWWVPLSGLSWLPSKIACRPLPLLQVPSPHPSIVDGFKCSIKPHGGLLFISSTFEGGCLVEMGGGLFEKGGGLFNSTKDDHISSP